jgi:chromosome segregation ATPase
MAEIIDSEKIREKLKEFDKYIQQAIDMAGMLKGIKDDTQKIFSELQSKKGQLSIIEDKLTEFFAKGEKVSDKIESLKKEGEKIEGFINVRKQEIEQYLSDTKQQQDDSINIKFHEIKSEVVKLYEEKEKEIDALKQDTEVFKEQISELITNYQQKADKEMTDFLYKQNALVSNLNQQIDSYHKLTETMKDNLDAQAKEIEGLKNMSEKHRKLIESLTSQNTELKNKMAEIISELKKPLVKKIFGGK